MKKSIILLIVFLCFLYHAKARAAKKLTKTKSKTRRQPMNQKMT